MATIILATGTETVTLSKFTNPSYPRKYIEPDDEFDRTLDYVPVQMWEIEALVLPTEAGAINRIYREFLNTDIAITLTDTTGLVFDNQTVFETRFSKPPIFSEEGRLIKVNLAFKEAYPNPDRWRRGLTISNQYTSVTIPQRAMDDRYPWSYSDPESGNIYKDIEKFRRRHRWQISAFLTEGEAIALKSIFDAFVTHAQTYGQTNVSVVDGTLINITSGRAWFEKPPQFSSDVEKSKKSNRCVKVELVLEEPLNDDNDTLLWNRSLTLSGGGASVVFKQEFMPEDKYPYSTTDPQGSIDSDPNYEIRNRWEITCRLTEEEAASLRTIFNYNSQTPPEDSDVVYYVSVVDTTLFNVTSNRVRFVKSPSYDSDDSDDAKKDGRRVKVRVELEEDDDQDNQILKGYLQISNGGGSVRILQKYMEEKFPRLAINDTTGKLEYSILGASIIDGPINPKHQWNVNANLTPSEYHAAFNIAMTANTQRVNYAYPAIAIADATTGGVRSFQGYMTSFPQASYNEKSRKRPYKVQFTLQEL